MRTLFIAVAALAMAGAGQSSAQPEHSAKAETVYAADPANPSHDECKAVMGGKMDPAVTHDHGAMKGAPTATQHRKPLSKSQMAKMHTKCAAKLASSGETPKK
jgi:hypothetical protein